MSDVSVMFPCGLDGQMRVDSQYLGQLLSFHMGLVVNAKAEQCGAKHGLLRDLWSFTCNTLEVI